MRPGSASRRPDRFRGLRLSSAGHPCCWPAGVRAGERATRHGCRPESLGTVRLFRSPSVRAGSRARAPSESWRRRTCRRSGRSRSGARSEPASRCPGRPLEPEVAAKPRVGAGDALPVHECRRLELCDVHIEPVARPKGEGDDAAQVGWRGRPRPSWSTTRRDPRSSSGRRRPSPGSRRLGTHDESSSSACLSAGLF
jgi:hypothetical protein